VQDLLSGLNEEQKKAVLQTEGPLLIQAGAGSGKTKTLTHRIAYILQNNLAQQQQILAVTFTNKAAKEMRERIAHLLGARAENRSLLPWMGTFHGICVRLLRQDGEYIGVPRTFVIYDESDRLAAVKQEIKKLQIDDKTFPPRAISGLISSAKNEALSPEEYRATAISPAQQAAAQVFPGYQKALKEAGALDFDDLISKTLYLLLNHEEVRKKWKNQFRYIMIDEYQDTNKVQYKISKLLAERNRNICVVGDADQNIYSWRGANIENILNFEKDYKEAKVILLEKNYRSTKVILQAANSVIIKNSVRKDKKLFTDNDRGEKITLIASYSETDEARSVAQIIDKMIKNGQKPSDIAILFRTNFQSRAIEDSLIKMNIPYQMIGTKFFERKEIKDVLSYLRVSLNRDSWGDMARIINVPTRGIGKATLAKISSGFFDDLSSSMKDKINSFYGLLDKIEKKSKTDKPSEIIRFIIKESGLEMSLKTKDIEDEERLRNIYELVSVAQIYDDLETEDSLSQFMENASLSSDQDEIKDEKDAVRVMTVHASKGLEFDTVFITGLEQDLFPLKHMSEKEIGLAEEEEERRLFYVALTRAKKKVYLSYAITRKVFGSEKINNSSEFIDDIELELIEEHKAERLTGVKAIFSDF
jgi:DNA helicase-2/ATP-dependent DNA helicase PcrA